MKPLLIAIAACILSISIPVTANENVTLTATDGRKVEVEILNVSSDGKEVTSQATDSSLTEADIRAIAEEYAKAWEDHNFDALKSLLSNFHNKSKALTQGRFDLYDVRSVVVGEVDGHNVHLKMKLKGGRILSGWLQITADGKIKYTPLLFKHPIYNAFRSLDYLLSEEPVSQRMGVKNLSEAGIPLFDYEVDGAHHKRKKSVDDIIKWLIKNGATWDQSEPKIYCPRKQFEECVNAYKYQ